MSEARRARRKTAGEEIRLIFRNSSSAPEGVASDSSGRKPWVARKNDGRLAWPLHDLSLALFL